MPASESPQPRRSLRVRLTRPSPRQTVISDSGSDSDGDSQDAYEPPRKRARTSSCSSPEEKQPRTPVASSPSRTRPRQVSLLNGPQPHLRQGFPADDPEMVPIAPQARRAAVRSNLAHPEDDRFASLRTRAQARQPEPEEGWAARPSQAPAKQGEGDRSSARERVHQAQAARRAEMEASLSWAAGLGAEEDDTSPGAHAELQDAHTTSSRPQRRGRSKLEQLRQQTAGTRAGHGGHGARGGGGTGPHGGWASHTTTSDRLREARELRQAELEAKQAWASFHARQAGRDDSAEGGGLSLPPEPSAEPEIPPTADQGERSSSPEPASASKGAHSLASWLGLAPKDSEVVDPVSCEAAQLIDRDSLFVGYVYPLESARPAEVATVLNHLAHRVHPHVPVHLLPPALRAAPAGKRGASHDMYALRVLQLRPGRTGEKGAADYSVVEETEDDGEKWGAQKVLNAMREQGIVDAICIVSRWYGGVLLGPDRFAHIHKVATHALQAFRTQEQIAPIVAQLVELDQQLDSLRGKLAEARGTQAPAVTPSTAAKYAHVQALDQAQRLLTARQTAVRAQTRVLVQVQQQSKAPP